MEWPIENAAAWGDAGRADAEKMRDFTGNRISPGQNGDLPAENPAPR